MFINIKLKRCYLRQEILIIGITMNPYSSNKDYLFGIASISSIARITVSSMSTSIPTSICYTLVHTGGSNISTMEEASIRTSISIIDMSSISTVDEVGVAVARSSRITRGG